VTIDTNGNHVAVAYLAGGNDSRGQGSVRLYDARTGVFQTQLIPPADYGEMYGWCDAKKSITYKNDMLSWEGNGEMKATLTYMP
jgi:hypothetical protein